MVAPCGGQITAEHLLIFLGGFDQASIAPTGTLEAFGRSRRRRIENHMLFLFDPSLFFSLGELLGDHVWRSRRRWFGAFLMAGIHAGCRCFLTLSWRARPIRLARVVNVPTPPLKENPDPRSSERGAL